MDGDTGHQPWGAITGWYVNLASGPIHGFLRDREGNITTFDAPGAGTGSGQDIMPFGINPAGTITGFYFDASHVAHGFVRE